MLPPTATEKSKINNTTEKKNAAAYRALVEGLALDVVELVQPYCDDVDDMDNGDPKLFA
jgi:hypothetical protein